MIPHFHYDPVWWNTQSAYTQTWDHPAGLGGAAPFASPAPSHCAAPRQRGVFLSPPKPAEPAQARPRDTVSPHLLCARPPRAAFYPPLAAPPTPGGAPPSPDINPPTPGGPPPPKFFPRP